MTLWRLRQKEFLHQSVVLCSLVVLLRSLIKHLGDHNLKMNIYIYIIYIIHSIPYLGNLIQNALPTDLIYDIAFILFSLIMLITNIISYKRLKNYFSNIK